MVLKGAREFVFVQRSSTDSLPAFQLQKWMRSMMSSCLEQAQGMHPQWSSFSGWSQEFDENGKAYGVTSEGETAKCKKVVCDPHTCLPRSTEQWKSPSFEQVKNLGRVARAICNMSHPVPNTNDSHSVQIILPQKQLSRKSDICVFCCSYAHNVAPEGKYIAFVSTEAETKNPEIELKPGIDLLGAVDETFFDIYDRYEPVNNPEEDSCFVSTSYDPTTHFESTVQDVLSMYRKITGKELDLSVDLSAASAAAEE